MFHNRDDFVHDRVGFLAPANATGAAADINARPRAAVANPRPYGVEGVCRVESGGL